MNTHQPLSKGIITAIQTAQQMPVQKLELYSDPSIDLGEFENELLFFIKPEITKFSPTTNMDAVLNTIFEKLDQFGVQIVRVQLLGASYLKDSHAMASHYGVINKVASDPKAHMSAQAKDKFKELFGADISEVPAYGGIEALAMYPELTPTSLESLWKTGNSVKLAGGTYCSLVEIDNKPVYLINGFHPLQLEHFIAEGRSIVAFHVVSNTDWSTLRTNLIGATNPSKAEAGSLRNQFLMAQNFYGLDEVSQGSNGVHLSAGPIEGTVEISRFFDGPDKLEVALPNRPVFKSLSDRFAASEVFHIMQDGKVQIGHAVMSAYDATEEKNSGEAVALLSNSHLIIG